MSTASYLTVSQSGDVLTQNLLELQAPIERGSTRAKACCLAPELLVEIFLYTQAIWGPRGISTSRDFYFSGWMSVLHVCGVWREVAISAPLLWQEIYALQIHPDLAREVLSRSAHLNLRLKFFPFHRFKNSLEGHPALSRDIWFAKPVFRRVETLQVWCYGPHEQWQNLLSQGAPEIRQLMIHAPYNAINIPSNMLGPSLPHFLQLQLSHCNIMPSSSFFVPTLTHLRLRTVNLSQDGSLYSGVQVLSLLATLPALEYLELGFDYLIDSEDTTLQQVSLPALKYLSLDLDCSEYPSAEFAAILQKISAPPTVNIVVNATFIDEWDRSVYLKIFSAVFKYSSDNKFPYSSDNKFPLELDLTSDDRWCCYGWNPSTQSRINNRRIDVSIKPDADIECHLDLEGLLSTARPQSLVLGDNFWQYLPNHEPGFSPSIGENPSLWDSFSTAQDVRHLTVCYCDHGRLWSMLSSKPELFPLLEKIVVTNVRWCWGDSSRGRVGFEQEEPYVHKCTFCEAELLCLVSELVGAIGEMHEAEVCVREVKIMGPMARWCGWESVRTVLGNLKLTSAEPTVNNAADDNTYSLILCSNVE